MNSTSYFYNHSSQWRYETVTAEELLSPMADKSRYTGHLIDFNVRAERMGWLPSAPQLGTNPLTIAGEAEKAGMNPVDYTVKSLKEGSIRFAAEQPENGKNHPRNLFIWRSNLLGSSGKGHEFMLKYLLGTEHGIRGKDLGQQGGVKPEEVDWQDNGLEGKLDLVVTLDFRLSSTCLYSDIILPTATLVRKRRHEYFGYASVYSPAVCGGRSGLGSEKRLGNLQSHREEILRSVRRPSG